MLGFSKIVCLFLCSLRSINLTKVEIAFQFFAWNKLLMVSKCSKFCVKNMDLIPLFAAFKQFSGWSSIKMSTLYFSQNKFLFLQPITSSEYLTSCFFSNLSVEFLINFKFAGRFESKIISCPALCQLSKVWRACSKATYFLGFKNGKTKFKKLLLIFPSDETVLKVNLLSSGLPMRWTLFNILYIIELHVKSVLSMSIAIFML